MHREQRAAPGLKKSEASGDPAVALTESANRAFQLVGLAGYPSQSQDSGAFSLGHELALELRRHPNHLPGTQLVLVIPDSEDDLTRHDHIELFLIVVGMIVFGIALAVGLKVENIHAPGRDAHGLPDGSKANTGDCVLTAEGRHIVDAVDRQFFHHQNLASCILGLVTSPLVHLRPTGHKRARGILSTRKSGDRVQAWRYAPSDALKGVVECYWAGEWDLRGQPPHHNEMLPDPCMHLVVEQGPSGLSARWVGVWTKRWRRTMKDWGKVWGIKLKVGACQAFLPQPAHATRDQILTLEDIDAHAVANAPDHAHSFAIMAEWLEGKSRIPDRHTELALAAMELVKEQPDISTMQAWAESMGLTPRAMQRLFREQVGATPKWVLRRMRLQEAAYQIERSRDEEVGISLTELAHRLGYTDHPHFCRDFKRAVGKTPSSFLSQDE